MSAPLVPANLDLRDFPFMPFEFGRLFASETWVLSNDAEKVAAITLWGKSWVELPAGSLPSDDRMLAHLSGAMTRWRKVKPMALRGWLLATDGRLYHPVVCEKALEAWLEKLGKRLSSGAGNARQWGVEFDPTRLQNEILESRELLGALNPKSRQLTRRKPPAVPTGQKTDPTGMPDGLPTGLPSGSQETETGTETGRVEAKASNPDGLEVGDAAAPPTGADLLGGTEAGQGIRPRKQKTPDCPHEQIIALYHDVLPMCSPVLTWEEPRRGYLRGRWRQDPDRQSLEWWKGYFEFVRGCPFLIGEAEPTSGRKPFVADLEWLVRPTNFAKVIEGRYAEGRA